MHTEGNLRRDCLDRHMKKKRWRLQNAHQLRNHPCPLPWERHTPYMAHSLPCCRTGRNGVHWRGLGLQRTNAPMALDCPTIFSSLFRMFFSSFSSHKPKLAPVWQSALYVIKTLHIFCTFGTFLDIWWRASECCPCSHGNTRHTPQPPSHDNPPPI